MMLGYGAAFAVGAALMYGFDPHAGRRRRARVRNEAQHLVSTTVRNVQKASLDSAQRFRGALIRLERRLIADVADDDVLAERVRSRLGRCCTHPGALTVSCREGVVDLGGPISSEEAGEVVRQVRHVVGVTQVSDALERRNAPVDRAAAQEPMTHVRHVFHWRTRWPISTRWAAGAGGAALAASGFARRGIQGAGLAAIGSGLILRAAFNQPLSTLFGGGAAGENGIDVSKTVTIDAPIEQVFDAFVAFENFPKFMRHVRHVHRTGDNRWNWIVEAPRGFRFDWESVVTELVPRSSVTWTSTEGATIRNRGQARFERVSDRATRVKIRLVYEPPLGIAGHAVAKLLGADPKRELDEDMLRFKSLLEKGKATGHDGQVTRVAIGQ
jgi:uncharacterized membrane protein